jgi:hypothetical protein
VSAGPDPNEVNLIEQARRQINRLAEEVAHLSEMDLPPANYYGEFLQRVLTAIAAPAGAVWLRTPQGNLQLQYQVNMQHVGLNRTDESRETHNKLLEEAFKKAQPGLIPPQSSMGDGGPGNPTDFVILVAPIIVEKQVEGLVEVWQDPHRGPEAQRGFLQFIVRMAALASGYTRNYQLRQMVGQQQVWTQLESFARQVHATLNPTEVAYLVANEGRRLVECDRVSVAVRHGRRVSIEAISGADVVEKRSNLVVLMRALLDEVLKWNEKLVYTGTKDDTLPPAVLRALDEYLAESNSKLLVCLPLRDERESESKKPARSCLLMEAFEPQTAPEQLIARLEVVGRHCVSALYNAVEHRRIPMRFLWLPLAKLQEGLGGKGRFILTMIGAFLIVFFGAMIFVPYPLKMDASGQLLPKERAWMFSPADDGIVRDFAAGLKAGSQVFQGQELIEMFSANLGSEVMTLQRSIEAAQGKVDTIKRALNDTPANDKQQRTSLQTQLAEGEGVLRRERDKLEAKRELFNADLRKPGVYWLRAPMSGIILTGDFREQLRGMQVKPGQPLLRIGKVDAKEKRPEQWEVELKIPQKHIGQILTAFNQRGLGNELDVDILLVSKPTTSYRGKLLRDRIAKEAAPNKNENNESEPVVLAWVRIEGEGIPDDMRLPPELLLTGTGVHTRVRCGTRAMGYSLFYGVWEWFYENVVFFF